MINQTDEEIGQYGENSNETLNDLFDNNDTRDVIESDYSENDNNIQTITRNDMSSKVSAILEERGFRHLSKCKNISMSNINIIVPPYIILFIPFPFLQMRILPKLKLNLNFEICPEIDPLNSEIATIFDVSGDAEVETDEEIGVYIPPISSPMQISLSVGIKGILGSGTVGMKLSLFVNESKIQIELFEEFKKCNYYFYILFKVKVNMGFIKFSFSFYLMKVKLYRTKYSKTTKKIYELPNYK